MTELELLTGPRTRLAAALLTEPAPPGVERALLVRHDADEAWAAATHPGLRRVRPEQVADLAAGASYERVSVLACALGAMTPAPDGTLEADSAALLRDLGALRALVAALPGVSVHIAFVSTVLVLSPRRERQYYAGWKCIAEYELAREYAGHAAVTVSVVYPGRLVERRSVGPGLLYTPYDALARRLRTLARAGVDARRVVGADARVWLVVRGVQTATGSVMSQSLPEENLSGNP